MIIKEGKNKEEMMRLLTELDGLTQMDSLVKTGEKLILNCTREGGKLKHWELDVQRNKIKPKPFAKGFNGRFFMKRLDAINEESNLYNLPDCNILCYISTDPKKNWDGTVKSHWLDIEPGCPYEIINNVPSFSSIELDLTEEEHYSMTQTGLAFHCKSSDVLYPITELAYTSIGRLFDCTAAFSNVDKHLLGSALLLAEKVSYATQVRIISRSRNARVKPVLAVAGKRYALFSQKSFFETALLFAGSIVGLYNIDSWSISDEVSILNLRYPSPWEPFEFGLSIQTGDIPQYAFKVTLTVKLEDKELILLENSEAHSDAFGTKDIEDLFNGVQEAIDLFRETYEILEHSTCEFSNNVLYRVNKILGKKRVNELKKIKPGHYPALELFMDILESRYVKMPDSQLILMQRELVDVFYKLSAISEIKTKAFA